MISMTRHPAKERQNSVAPILVAILALGLAFPATAQTARLDEQTAIAAAQGRDDLRNAMEGTVDASMAEEEEAGVWTNPSFEYERDRTKGAGGTTVQDTYRLSQPVDVSGRRGLRQDAAKRRVEATRAETQQRTREVGGEASKLFYTVLMRQQAKAAAERWAARLVEAETVLDNLRGGREVSGYDARRLTRERITADTKARALRADLVESWERLRTLMGWPPDTAMPQIEGVLLPPPPLGLDDLMSRIENRRDLLALRAKVAASNLDRQAADRSWIPDITLGVGLKQVEQPDRSDQGVLLTASAPLPLFDRGQAASRKAAAQSRVTAADMALARAKAEGEIRGLWRRTGELRETALTFRESALAASRDLSRIAEGAYRAGEMNVLELIDAHKSLLEAETTAVELEFGAREAHTELTLATGETSP
jgi:cobalt-zinc-cadmium efflux system outer membrane protein